MKCPNDRTEMEEGIINGGYWTKRTGMWKKSQSMGKKFSLVKAISVIAYKCPKCKKIELYTE